MLRNKLTLLTRKILFHLLFIICLSSLSSPHSKSGFKVAKFSNTILTARLLARSEPVVDRVRREPSPTILEQQRQQLKEKRQQIREEYQRKWSQQQQQWRNQRKRQLEESQEYRRQNQERVYQRHELRREQERNRRRQRLQPFSIE